MLTQGRLVPRQPWAIKRTTPTALRGCNIRHGGFIHGNADIISTALRGCNIRNDGFTHGNADIISMHCVVVTFTMVDFHSWKRRHNIYGVASLQHSSWWIHSWFLISSAEILDTNCEFLSSINRNLFDFKASVDLVIKKK